jgi:general secretion pathway protein D
VSIFDVDWLKGMSFGFFRLQYADAATVVSEVEQVVGAQGSTPLSGLVRLIPVPRLNAVLVITHSPRYMDEMASLIEEFDVGVEGAPGQRLYVYHLENGRAENIAGVLQEIFSGGEGQPSGGAAPLGAISEVPPGRGLNVFQTAEAISEPPPPVTGGSGAGGDYPRAAALTGPGAGQIQPPAGPAAAAGTVDSLGNVSIIADQDNNAVLVMASAQDYRAIEAVIRQLDIPPRQVLIDATIAEVTLSEGLDFGVRWFLQQNNLSLGFNAPVPEVASGEGLALAVFQNSGDARLFIDTLATETSVKFLSAPQVMVLDNQTASIRVGDQIPVTVRTSQSTVDPQAPIVSEVQFRDTGTLLSVTPRINAGGKVAMEISQEVSLPGSEPAVGGGGNVAISQRTIDSSVVVQSGETVVLGGLILETRTAAESGIPLLKDIPWLGSVFRTTTEDKFRTELIVLITPQVVENDSEAMEVTEELRRRIKKPIEYQNLVKPM